MPFAQYKFKKTQSCIRVATCHGSHDASKVPALSVEILHVETLC